VPGVREISVSDIELGDKIAQGGFSVIHKGKLNGTPVAIKKIFDPRLTDELLQEIQNEIVMQSILRHPNIAILMGVIPKIPDIYIVFEHVSQGSLYDMLHMKKSTIDLSVKERIRIARDAATVFEYMHHLGIVHRDIKSHNVLIDSSFHVKVCDFGLAKFIVSIFSTLIMFRLTSAKVLCNTQAPQLIWPQSSFKREHTTNQLTCLLLVVYFGR
jgi:serine/threonine protein kinase